ncbi:hypothetical protein BKI52_21670 [marine bacterium AO1-C]|nr:hypothetical protein BKI52_21670 [marine bacterium AO1-C]
MKTHFSPSQSEQNAHQLWSQFTRYNQEAFWQQYEPLIDKTATKISSITQPKPSKKVRAVTPQTFHYLIFPYRIRFISFIVTIGIILSLLFLTSISTSEAKSYGNIISIIILLLLANYLWVFSIYDVSDEGLIITRNLSLDKTQFSWKEIQAVKIYCSGADEGTTTHLNILLKTNEVFYFKYPLFEDDHLTFLKILGQKRIAIDSTI